MATFSTTTRYTGLSGVDTEGMVTQLMKAESLKYNKLKTQQQVTAWKQEAYRGTSTTLKTFSDSFLNISASNSLRLGSTFNSNSSSVKYKGVDSSIVTITSSKDAEFGNHSLSIEQVASKDVKRSQHNLSSIKGGVADEISVPDLPDEESGYSFDLTFDGVTKKIRLTQADVLAINEEQDPPPEDPAAYKSQKLLDTINVKIKEAFQSPVGLDVVTLKKNNEGLVEFNMQVGKHTMSVKASEDGDDLLGLLGAEDGATTSPVDTTKSLVDAFGLSSGYTGSFKINGKEISFSGEDTIDKIMSMVNDPANGTGVKMSYSAYSGFSIEAKTTGIKSTIAIEEGNTDGTPNLLSDLLKMDVNAPNKGKDAIFTFDGARSTSDTNNIEIDGLKFTINSTTEPNVAVDLAVTNDPSKVIDLITKFVDAYNNLIGGLNTSVEEKRAKKSSYEYYEPLSDEQRSAMKDDQIKEWEGKAKQGLLNRDEILSGITSTMRSFLYEPVEYAPKKNISLYEIGITTSSNMKDRGKLVINKEKLTEALTTRMEDVETLFTKSATISSADKSKRYDRLLSEGLAERLNDIIDDAINSSHGTLTAKAGIKGGVSELTNQLTTQLKDQDEKLRELQEYLRNKENHYYTMFSKMESAMNSSNSQMSYLQSQFG